MAVQVFADPKAKAEVHSAADDRVHVAADEFQAQVQKAQKLYDQIHADPQFPQKYKETDRVLDPAEVRVDFAELSVDNLRSIRPK